MRAGLFLAYWPWFTPQEQVELAVLADELGLDSVWISEAWGQDAVSVLGLLAGKTERVALGSGLFQIPARAPAATAMAAATLDVLRTGASGSGSACPARRSPRAGTACRSSGPVARTREYVEIVRTALARKTVVHEGREYRVPLEGAKPLKLLAKPVQERIPVYLGAVGPKAVEQVGEIADGWLPFMARPEHAATLFEPLDRGLAKAGRTRADIDVAACTAMAVEDDLDAARDAVRPWLAFYLGAMGSREKNFYVELAERAGHGAAARECQEAFLGGDRERAAGGAHAGADRRDGAGHHARRAAGAAGRVRGGRRGHAARRCRAAPTAPGSPRALAEATRERGAAPGGHPGLRRCRARSRSATTRPGCASGCASSRACRSSARCSASRPAAPACGSSCATAPARCRARCGAATGTRSGIADLADGAQIVAAGGCDYYAGSRTSSPQFSFAVTGLRLAGEGDLLAQVERLRRTLHAEGLTEPQKRLPRPALPRTIGVVTGEGGKARDDVLAGLRRRGWGGRVVWAFAPVQDRHAAPAITRALQDLAACEPVEVIVVARGGGSLADLFAFCDETLCRTVAMLRVPVISSVGHHTDHTLIDDVAAVACSTPDARRRGRRAGRLRRAPAPRCAATPPGSSARAARAIVERARTLARLSRAPAHHVARHRTRLHQQLRELRAASARAVAEGERANRRRAAALERNAQLGRDRARRLDTLALALAAHDPQRTLERGYALVEGPGGAPVTSAAAAATWPELTLRMRDGAVRVRPDRRRTLTPR